MNQPDHLHLPCSNSINSYRFNIYTYILINWSHCWLNFQTLEEVTRVTNHNQFTELFFFVKIFPFFLCHVLGIDRVFRGDCPTRQVYEEGAREVALSVVSGINCKYNMSVLVSIMYLPRKVKVFTCFCFSSEYLCVWADKQWKDLHHDGDNWVYSGGYI